MKNNPHQNFTDLEVWKSARKLKMKIWDLAGKFPVEEKYRLADQLIRSSRGIGAVIAEGHGRFTYKEQINFCIIGRSSLSEVLHHLIDAMDCGYISKQKLKEYKTDIDETGKLLNGYITFLRKSVPQKKQERPAD